MPHLQSHQKQHSKLPITARMAAGCNVCTSNAESVINPMWQRMFRRFLKMHCFPGGIKELGKSMQGCDV